MAELGHNSGDPSVMVTSTGQGRLRSYTERLERLQSDKDDITADMKEVFSEAKAEGFDTKTMRKVLAERRKDAAQRQEEEALFDLYWTAIGEGGFD